MSNALFLFICMCVWICVSIIGVKVATYGDLQFNSYLATYGGFVSALALTLSVISAIMFMCAVIQ